MNDLDLSARLHDLADDLGGPHDELSTESVIARYHRRRRTRAGLIATVAAVVAIAVGVPTAVGSLSSSDGEVAVPTPPDSTTPAAPTGSADVTHATQTTVPTYSTRPADTSPDPAHVAELEQVAAGLPALTLTAPQLWDRWLPEGRPYPQASIDEDALTCPRLSARLTQALGVEMSYWTGTLPGPMGCSWARLPFTADGPVHPDYDVRVVFVADGTTADEYHHTFREGLGQGTHYCPTVDVPSAAGPAVLVRCAGDGVDTYALAVPDLRVTGGVWELGVNVRRDALVPVSEVFGVLVDGVAAAFG